MPAPGQEQPPTAFKYGAPKHHHRRHPAKDGIASRRDPAPSVEFAFYAAFRAVYGVGILIVTYIVASETQSLSASVGVLIASMIISRVIFRSLSSRRGAEEG